jgi:hypothetical protein
VLSVKRVLTSAAAPAPLLVMLAGCATTQEEAARLQVNSARIRASELAVRVTRTNRDIRVERVELIAGRHRAAIIVTLKNATSQPVSDLPISVGLGESGGRRHYLNAASGTPYFLNHIPAVPAGGLLTWVFTTRQPPASGERPFAMVGTHVPALVSSPRTLPQIAAATVAGAAERHGRGDVRVVVHNLSSIPQYGLQVYEITRRAGREVGAGQATIAHLGERASTTLTIALVGSGGPGTVMLEASPTMFR